MSVDPQAPRRASHRGRRWLIAGASLLTLVIAARVAAPFVIAAQIESRLSAALGAPVRVEDVDLRLWAGEATVHGLHVAPAEVTSASSARVGELHLRWRWPDVVHGSPPLDLRLADVAVTLDLHEPWPGELAEPAGTGLGPLRSLSLRGGHLEVVPAPDAAPVLVLDDVHGTLLEGAWHARGEAMTTAVRLAATAGANGRLEVTAAVSPVRPGATWTAHVVLDRLDLRPLNPLFAAVLEMTVERGTLSLTGDLTTTGGRMRGYLTPSFDELTLLAPGEQVRHPMAEALFSSMLATADLPIEIDQEVGALDGGLALALDQAFRADAMELLRRVILRGFTRRLDSLIGHDATIGGLEVDFPRGVLAFTDVTLRKTGGTATTPFLQVARLEVIVEPSIVDPDAETFKSVVLHKPRFALIVDHTEAGTQRSIDPDWQDKVSALPFPTDRLRVIDGSVEYRDETTRPPSHFVLSGLDVTAAQLARAAREPGSRGATVSARALVMGESPLKVDVAFTPGGSPVDGEVHLALAPVQMSRLNGLLRSRFGIDVSTGTLGLTADLDARDGAVTGTVTPKLANVSVLGSKETDITRPLRELLIEIQLKRLDGVRLRLAVDAGPDMLKNLPGALLRAIRETRR
jgi:hypothetical protein